MRKARVRIGQSAKSHCHEECAKHWKKKSTAIESELYRRVLRGKPTRKEKGKLARKDAATRIRNAHEVRSSSGSPSIKCLHALIRHPLLSSSPRAGLFCSTRPAAAASPQTAPATAAAG